MARLLVGKSEENSEPARRIFPLVTSYSSEIVGAGGS